MRRAVIRSDDVVAHSKGASPTSANSEKLRMYHGIHLLGGLYFWGKVSSKIFKLNEKDYNKEEKSINALSLYWLFLFIVWLVFFTIMFAYSGTVIEFCRSLIA